MNRLPETAALKKGLYRLPWTASDNPQCFLEVTLNCNARCEACYQHRVLGMGHKSLELILREADILVRVLNPSAICIVGGEPLEHPDLDAVVRHISGKGIVPALFTNAINLTPTRLSSLATAGLRAVYGHIDLQTRQARDELAVMKDRDRFADLLRHHRGRLYGLVSAMIGRNNLAEAGAVRQWALDNSDIIKYCVFTIEGHKTGNDDLEAVDVAAALKASDPAFRINTYLGGIDSQSIHWAQSLMWRRRCLSPRTVRLMDRLYRLIAGRYVSILPPWVFGLADFFTTVIVRPHRRGTVDFCESCPDQTIVWVRGDKEPVPRVVHSCTTPDFLATGRSPEEDDLTLHLGRFPWKAARARCAGNAVRSPRRKRIVDV